MNDLLAFFACSGSSCMSGLSVGVAVGFMFLHSCRMGNINSKIVPLGMIIANLNVAIMESNIFFDYMHAYATADIISG